MVTPNILHFWMMKRPSLFTNPVSKSLVVSHALGSSEEIVQAENRYFHTTWDHLNISTGGKHENADTLKKSMDTERKKALPTKKSWTFNGLIFTRNRPKHFRQIHTITEWKKLQRLSSKTLNRNVDFLTEKGKNTTNRLGGLACVYITPG